MLANSQYISLIAAGLSQHTGVKVVAGEKWEALPNERILKYVESDLRVLPFSVVRGLLLTEIAHMEETTYLTETPTMQKYGQKVMSAFYRGFEEFRVTAKIKNRYGYYAENAVDTMRAFGIYKNIQATQGNYQELPRAIQFLLLSIYRLEGYDNRMLWHMFGTYAGTLRDPNMRYKIGLQFDPVVQHRVSMNNDELLRTLRFMQGAVSTIALQDIVDKRIIPLIKDFLEEMNPEDQDQEQQSQDQQQQQKQQSQQQSQKGQGKGKGQPSESDQDQDEQDDQDGTGGQDQEDPEDQDSQDDSQDDASGENKGEQDSESQSQSDKIGEDGKPEEKDGKDSQSKDKDGESDEESDTKSQPKQPRQKKMKPGQPDTRDQSKLEYNTDITKSVLSNILDDSAPTLELGVGRGGTEVYHTIITKPTQREAESLLRPYSIVLAQRLQDILKELKQTRFRGAYDNGKLLNKNTYKVLIPNESKIFSKKSTPDAPDYSIHLALDNSGSMEGMPATYAFLGAVLLDSVSKLLKFDSHFYEYDEDCYEIKNLDKYDGTGGGTYDAAALQEIAGKADANRNNLVFIITDGNTARDSRFDYYANILTKQKNATLIGIGIGKNLESTIKKNYEVGVAVKKVEDLPMELVNILRRVIHR